MPLLRGHHLVCLHFFNGEGYDEAFINNLKNLSSLVEKEKITVSSGADDVCRSCHYSGEKRCLYSESSEEEIKGMDAKALSLLALSCEDKVIWLALKEKICRIFPEWFSLYCIECDWRKTCEKNVLFQSLLKNL